MKEGTYCIKKNNEYRFSQDINGNSYISTKDKSIIYDFFIGPNERDFYKNRWTG